MSIIQVLSRFQKLPNDSKEGGIVAFVRPKPPQTLFHGHMKNHKLWCIYCTGKIWLRTDSPSPLLAFGSQTIYPIAFLSMDCNSRYLQGNHPPCLHKSQCIIELSSRNMSWASSSLSVTKMRVVPHDKVLSIVAQLDMRKPGNVKLSFCKMMEANSSKLVYC